MSGTVRLRVRRVEGADPSLPLPAYQTEGAAALDLAANLPEAERVGGRVLAPGARALIGTGLAFEIPQGYEVQLRPRSGLALRNGVTLLNAPATIDSDYRGEVGVVLANLGATSLVVEHGMRIAQMVLAPVIRVAWEEASTLGATARGSGGFGSTGRG